MTSVYADSSCIVATAFGELHSDTIVRRLLKFDRVFSSTPLEAEVMAALRREGREITPIYSASVELIAVDGPPTAEISRVLAACYLRAADCLHIATALFIEPKPKSLTFLTLDTAQQKVAKTLGFELAERWLACHRR